MTRPKTASSGIRFDPGTLWPRVLETTRRALAKGVLQPIETSAEYVEQNNIRFVVRQVSSLARKERAKTSQDRSTRENPFLPYDEDLFVADVSDTHVCLLNKFNVIQHHLLIVTRDFEDQGRLLNKSDFEALWACLLEIDGLGFYNGGTIAGASQPHKHLQIATLPLAPNGPEIPIEPVIESAVYDGDIGTVDAFPFRHAIARIEADADDASELAELTLKRYLALLDVVGLSARPGAATRQAGPYNLLVTRHWMMLAPRSRETVDSISVNALGFAGSLLVRDREQLETVKRLGPMNVLREAGMRREQNF